ncbi:hypothetical protein [Sporosarcina ureilytica]|uniref:Transcriptional regulator n=1 Tax=Sporosarcina ureilytica TaxID=298596 RepID=A0A1D8JDN2_9BACL|nr:hypothetical protein [Sporosarcina ureilytica]AOV06788.1 hypothetical protein BI350_03760 [Sporosarcina ureilytica]
MISVGIIGPHSTVKKILHTAQRMHLDILFQSFPYEKVKETKRIIEENRNSVDFWIFSGRISYNIAYQEMKNKERLIYIHHTEAGIFKGLIEFTNQTQSPFDYFSIDEISKSHLEDAFNQLTIKREHIFLKTFSEKTSTEELIQFHYHHWQNGHTKGAITCYEEVYLQLKKMGVPAFRISTSDIEIKHTLTLLSERIKTIYFKDSQVAVLLFEMVQLESYFKSSKQIYELQFLELKLKKILILLSEQLNGSFVEKGLGRYLIFSSRGDTDREIQKIEETVNDLILESGLKVGIGIGFGETVFLAELNANHALRKSKEDGGIILVQENGEVIEAESENLDTVEFPYFNDKNFINTLKKENINLKHYIETFALVKKSGVNEFTVKDISTQLARDERNTRRFIESLCEAGLAECIGHESLQTRGRPRRIYKLMYAIK